MFFKIRKDIEMHNLAKRYLAQLIKEECWNSMAVKGRALKVMGTTPAITSLLMRIFIERSHGRKCLQRTFVILRKSIYRKAFKSCCAFPVLSPCYVIFSCLILPSMLSIPVLPSRHLLRFVSAPLSLFLLRHYLHPGLTICLFQKVPRSHFSDWKLHVKLFIFLPVPAFTFSKGVFFIETPSNTISFFV